jgi:hypothetical protein
VIASAFTWPGISDIAWSVKAIWYTALLLALGAICTATQQGVFLLRLAAHPKGPAQICSLLSKGVEDGEDNEPRLLQLYIWQVPISPLNGSVYLFIVGLGVLLWDAAQKGDLNWSNSDTKVWPSYPNWQVMLNIL